MQEKKKRDGNEMIQRRNDMQMHQKGGKTEATTSNLEGLHHNVLYSFVERSCPNYIIAHLRMKTMRKDSRCEKKNFFLSLL